MNKSDTISTLIEIGPMAATWASLWVSLTFEFLTVSYFIGAALSRFQCLAISILYATSTVLFGGDRWRTPTAGYCSTVEKQRFLTTYG